VGNGRFNFGLEVKDRFLGRFGTTSAVFVTPPKLTAKQTRTQLPYLKRRLSACAEKKVKFIFLQSFLVAQNYSYLFSNTEIL
jgi:hypothetical protein